MKLDAIQPVRRASSDGRPPPTLTTARLVLRPLEPGDTEAVAVLAGDPAVANQLDRVPSPFPRALAARWIARRNLRWREKKGVTLAITRPPDRALIGTVSLRVSTTHRHAELGYWVAVDAWGDGLATEACSALITWAFTALQLHRVHARVLADNPASLRVATKLGLVLEGVRPQHYRRGGAFIDVLELGVARTGWPPVVTAAPPARRPTAARRPRPRRPRRS